MTWETDRKPFPTVTAFKNYFKFLFSAQTVSRKRHPRNFPPQQNCTKPRYSYLTTKVKSTFSAFCSPQKTMFFLSKSPEQKSPKKQCVSPSPIRPATDCGSTRAALAMQPRRQSPQQHQNPVIIYQGSISTFKNADSCEAATHFQPFGTLYSSSARHCSLSSLSLQATESS